MALTDLTRISTSGIATGTSLSGAILHGDAHFRGTQVGVTSALFDSSDDALEFGDNVKLRFGASNDLSLFHNASDSVISHSAAGEGSLKILSGGAQSIECIKAGAVELAHNGNKKLETDQAGVKITGVLTATSFSGPIIGSPINNPSGISTFYDLRVSNNLTVEGTTTTLDTNLIGVDRVEVGANSNTVTGIAVTQSGTADIVRLYDGSTQVVTVDDTGKVGLGTPTPAVMHHLYSASGGLYTRFEAPTGQVNFGNSNGAGVIHVTSTSQPLRFLVNGSNERARIASDGKFGIGDFSSGTVQQALHVKGSDPKIFLEHTGGYDLTIATNTGAGQCGIIPSGGYLDLCSNNTSLVACQFAGNVGVGTISPQQKLHVHKSSGGTHLLISGDVPSVILNPNPANSSDNDRSNFGQATGNNNFVNGSSSGDTVLRGTSSGKLLFGLGTSAKMRINNDGSVNIGVSGDSTKLAVAGISGALDVDSRANISLFTGATDGAVNTGTGILFFNHSGSGQFFGGSIQVLKENSGNGNTDSLMRFSTRANGGAVTEQMRITSGGTLGINLTSPDTSFRVDCSGAAQFTTSTTNQQNDFLPGQLTVRNNQSNQGAFIDFRADSATGVQGVIAKIGGFNVHSGSGYDGNLIFSTRQTSGNSMVERLRIKNDGIVCLDSTAGAIIIGDNSINANYSSAKLYIRSGTHTQTSANTDMIQLSLYDRNSQRNGAEGTGSWKSKIQFLAAQINGGAREGAFIQQDIKYNNFSGGSTKMRADLVFATRGDAESSSSNPASEKLRITHNGNVLINGDTFYGSGSGALQVHDSTLVLSKVGSGTRNWRFVNNNIAAGNLGLQVSNADNGSTTYVDRIEIDKDGKVCIGNPATDPIANLEVHTANPTFYVRDSAETSVDNDAKIAFGNASHYPVAYLSHIWDGTSGSLTAHTRSGGNEYLALTIDAAQRIRTRGATNIGHGGMVYIQGYSDPVADETHSNLTVRGEGGNGFACGTYEATGNYGSWIQAGYVPNFTGSSPSAIYPLVLQPNGAPVCIGNYADAGTDDGGLLRIQTKDGSTKLWHDYGLTLEHIDGSNNRHQKFAFINANNQGTAADANSMFRQYAVPYQSGTTYRTFTDRIVYAHRPLYNQYSWYKFNVYAASDGRGGSARIAITWSSRHAGPGGYGEYSIAWTDNHSTTKVVVFCRKQHFISYGDASHGPYNWTSNPAVDVYESTGTTNSAGFYLRVQGHLDANSSTYEGGILHHFDIVHNDNNTGQFKTYFEFVSNSTPSDAGSALAFN